MYHFFVEKEQVLELYVEIEGSDFNHMKNVLRMKQGEKLQISVVDSEAENYICEIEEFLDEKVRLKILEKDSASTELPLEIILFQGIPKGDKMELIIQKSVELGVARIVPVVTKRTIVKLDKKKEESKLKRWQSIAESAAKQSKRQMIPQIAKVMTLKEAFNFSQEMDQKVIPYEEAVGMKETKELIKNIKKETSIGIFIGPEGGFDLDEIQLAKANNVIPISLGSRILRTETAGLALLSAIMIEVEGRE